MEYATLLRSDNLLSVLPENHWQDLQLQEHPRPVLSLLPAPASA